VRHFAVTLVTNTRADTAVSAMSVAAESATMSDEPLGLWPARHVLAVARRAAVSRGRPGVAGRATAANAGRLAGPNRHSRRRAC
jgi:hypothetical protein